MLNTSFLVPHSFIHGKYMDQDRNNVYLRSAENVIEVSPERILY